MAVWKMNLSRSANFVDLGLVSHSEMSRSAGCLLPMTTLTPSKNGPTSDEGVRDKPEWVLSATPCFIAYWRTWYLQLIQVWLQGGSEIPLQYNPTHCHCLSLRLMKIMVMNVFGALWLSHQLFLLLSLWFNIALLIPLIKKLIAFASLWSPFGESIW